MANALPGEILIATHNTGKAEELRRLAAALPVTLRYLRDFPDVGDVEETGSTFEENAAIKAAAYARLTAMWSIADDSGLEVDALGGEPGVYSARWGGPDKDFARAMRMIEEKLDAANARDPAERTGRFVAV
ncbi:MAG TPA: non-canonical purine NTP pyrophosphatase, partial [Pyrinomonadaceae bacterium]|nr:non-canonical purine NTP pyrophosphatase [Pyrinomonadaceae bacterium]